MRAHAAITTGCVLLLAGAPRAAASSPVPARSTSPRALLGPAPRLAGKSGGEPTTTSRSATTGQATSSDAPIPVSPSDTPPAGRKLSANRVLAIAAALPKIRAERARYPGSYGGAYLKIPFHWQVSYFSRNGKREIAQVIVDDGSARVLEQWTGFQVAWTMARGYPGAFGRHVNALYVWLPLCVLFLLPFVNPRRPFSLLHLDLLVLLSFSVSLAFFNHGRIFASVPLAYPPLVYLLARMLWLALRRPAITPSPAPGAEIPAAGVATAGVGRAERTAAPRPLRLLVPAPWLALGVVFLLGFRIALNVTDGNVIDVGYAGVIGAHRIVHGGRLYGSYPSDNEHGDTYGPVNYEAYVPVLELFGWHGRWDDLPAAHAAAVVFDLLALVLIFLLGRRVRGPTLGIALAYAWVSFPFTLFTLESNSNDTLVAVLVMAAVLVATSPPARGALAALAGMTKFAPLALAPLLATHGLRLLPSARRPRALALFVLAFLTAAALASVPALSHDSLATIYRRTILYQASRGSPFSLWGLYGGLGGLQQAVQIAAVLLALALAVIPRRSDLVGLAAACAAVMIATQLGIEHWFYLYIPWFFPLALLALLGGLAEPLRVRSVVASTPARSPVPAVGPGSGSALP